MIYVTADLHGCSVEEFKKLLDGAGFTEDDFLFVLGDVIDRGEHGAQLLLWLTEQPNMQLILGNHEAMLLSCGFLFEEVTEQSLEKLDPSRVEILSNWLSNGGAPTLTGLRRILKQDPELVYGILDYLRDAPLHETLTVKGKKFILVHAGLGNFHPDKPLVSYTPEELLFERPSMEQGYYDDATVIFGHTPTVLYGQEYRGRAVETKTWICIDTGSAMEEKPMLLRLEDRKAFYWA